MSLIDTLSPDGPVATERRRWLPQSVAVRVLLAVVVLITLLSLVRVVTGADDIVRNARIFHRRWGWWPMHGWLAGFEQAGLITRDVTGRPRKVAGI